MCLPADATHDSTLPGLILVEAYAYVLCGTSGPGHKDRQTDRQVFVSNTCAGK